MRILIAVLIIALFFAVFDGQLKNKEIGGLQEKNKALVERLDSVKTLQGKADLEALRLGTSLNLARQELVAQGSKIESLTKRYESLRLTPVPNRTDAGIDSAIARLYPPR